MPQTDKDKENAWADNPEDDFGAEYFNELETAEQLRASRRGKKVDGHQNERRENSSYPEFEEKDDANLSQLEKERQWAERMRIVSQLSRVGSTALSAAGYGQLGGALGNIGQVAGAAGSGKEGAAGGLRSAGSNLGGSVASKLAQRERKGKPGMSAGKSSALGGAVAGALAGEGVKGIGQSALSWYIVDAMFILLLDPSFILSPLALTYLNIHYVMSKRKSKWFRPMLLWQKYTLLLVDILFVIIALTIITLLYFAYKLYTDPIFAFKFGIGL